MTKKIQAFIRILLSREMLMYLMFGVLTTVVNYIAYYAFSRLADWESTVIPTAIAWVIAVLFAYLTNRRWVFKSTAKGFKPVARELAAFIGARAASGAIDIAIMYIFVDIAGFSDLIIKFLSNVLVIILNYVLSKLFVFKANR